MGGKIFAAIQQWLTLSKDKWFFDVVYGEVIEFIDTPVQYVLPRPLVLSLADRHALDSAMISLINQKVVESCDSFEDQRVFLQQNGYTQGGDSVD